MEVKEMDALANRGPVAPRPRCPHFRERGIERLYPVEGYCVLSQSSDCFMVPSIEEYREYCTTSRFDKCWWFQCPQAIRSPAGGDRVLAQADWWPPPSLLRPTSHDAD